MSGEGGAVEGTPSSYTTWIRMEKAAPSSVSSRRLSSHLFIHSIRSFIHSFIHSRHTWNRMEKAALSSSRRRPPAGVAAACRDPEARPVRNSDSWRRACGSSEVKEYS